MTKLNISFDGLAQDNSISSVLAKFGNTAVLH